MGAYTKNQVLITFDSLRWDVFEAADARFIKGLGEWKMAYAQGTYTLPAHMSYFSGKLPQVFDRTAYYDTMATRFTPDRGPHRDAIQLWRLAHPESHADSKYTLDGRNIQEGFEREGYVTIGTGAVGWFAPHLKPSKVFTESFVRYGFFGCYFAAEEQVDWAIREVEKAAGRQPYFLFINFGETHHPYREKRKPSRMYGHPEKCRQAQRAAVDYLSTLIKKLFGHLGDCDLVMCADHGDALGEDGLWGHGFCHPKVMEIPLLIVEA